MTIGHFDGGIVHTTGNSNMCNEILKQVIHFRPFRFDLGRPFGDRIGATRSMQPLK